MVDLAAINNEAKRIQFTRVLLTALAGALYGIGWATRKLFIVLWLAIAWSWTALKLGWQEAARGPDRQ